MSVPGPGSFRSTGVPWGQYDWRGGGFMADIAGRAFQNVSSLYLTGRTWDSAIEPEPEAIETALIVDVEPFPDDPHGTIVLRP